MLSEIENCRQITNEPCRRWFTDQNCDLIVWFDDKNNIYGFQYCYDKSGSERAITWVRDQAYSHKRVDTGEMYGRRPDSFTPILVPDGIVDIDEICEQFSEISSEIDSEITEFVFSLLARYPMERKKE